MDFAPFPSTLLEFNLSNLIYIIIILASCVFKFVQDIKSAQLAAIKFNLWANSNLLFRQKWLSSSPAK